MNAVNLPIALLQCNEGQVPGLPRNPHYCDVILARWEKLTGQTAVKIAD